MKKLVRILSITLVAVMLCATLASCGKVSGAYAAELDLAVAKTKVTYDFGAFGKVTITTEGSSILGNSETKTFEGKYKVTEKDDGKMEITFTYEADDDTVKSGTYSFEEGEDYIKINGIQYKKVEK